MLVLFLCHPETNGRGNPDGQSQTAFGHLSANKVPYVVIPQQAFNGHDIPPNALSAVVCDGKVFYGILGDTDGDTPEVIGEASILMAETCFPNEGLGGGNGHSEADVLCTWLYRVLSNIRYCIFAGI
jgi:chitosanase